MGWIGQTAALEPDEDTLHTIRQNASRYRGMSRTGMNARLRSASRLYIYWTAAIGGHLIASCAACVMGKIPPRESTVSGNRWATPPFLRSRR